MLDSSREVRLSTDVLVVGGGAAGCLAGMGAREKGAEVVIIEKGGAITRSGSCASGMDHIRALLDEAEWDTPEAFLASFGSGKAKPEDVGLATAFASNSKRVFEYLEDAGMPFRDRGTGKYLRITGLGETHPSTVSFEGAQFKPILARHVRRVGANVLEKVAVEGLLTDCDRVAGVVGFHIRTGDFYVILAKAVIVTTGGAVRFYPAPSGHNFVTHTPAFNTGDGQAMAFRAGAALTNMEFVATSVEPKGFSAPGLTGFVSCGAKLLNAKSERFMQSHPMGEHAPRNVLARAVAKEFAEGRGPVYFDCRGLTKEQMSLLIRGFLNEKPILVDLFAARGIDLTKDLVPCELREFDCNGNGIKIDEHCRASVDGLYAAGNCSSASFALGGACTLGFVAGEEAAAEVTGRPGVAEVNREQVARLKAGVFRALSGGSIHPSELETRLRQVMRDAVGMERSPRKLERARVQLEDLRKDANNLTASNWHELLRANEARNLIDVSLLIVAASLKREERLAHTSGVRDALGAARDDRSFVVMTGGRDERIDFSLATCS